MSKTVRQDRGPVVAEVSELTISYRADTRQVAVVDNVSFTLERGRTLGLVGESGSGKSTVARTLLGHLRAGSQIDHGRVSVHDEDVFGLTPERLRQLRGNTVGLVSQNAGDALTPSMRVGEQIAETLRVHGLPADRNRILELLELVRLPSPQTLRRRYPHELSGGQQQRVAIALATATDPDILVLDEPTTALDVITQSAVLDLVAELQSRLGMAVLIVSHDLGVVSAVADDVLVLCDGQTVEHGPAVRVLAAPEQSYTRKLLDAAPRVDGADPHSRTSSSQPHQVQPVREAAASAGTPEPAATHARTDPDADVLIRCADLDIRYPGAPRRAVDDFSIDLRRGESVAIVGESGSGKSTVASTLAGLTEAERGSAALALNGHDHDLLATAGRRSIELRRAVQLVFQNADLSLNPRRSVGDAIARPLKVFGRARGRRQTREAVGRLLTEVGLGPEYAIRLPGQLSGGQRQRVGIARALAAEPQVLIADEITTALDVSVQAEVLELLERLQQDHGLASIFISHDLAVVRRVADRIVVMKDGRIVESAPTADLFDDPRHAYTRQLLDAVLEPGGGRRSAGASVGPGSGFDEEDGPSTDSGPAVGSAAGPSTSSGPLEGRESDPSTGSGASGETALIMVGQEHFVRVAKGNQE
jgi:peptide/nickel transport system ATP-binding protein